MAETTGPGAAPRALIVTVYGLYARDSGGWLSVSLMIRLLAELGVDEPAVRSAISRLKRRGLLVASRRDGVAGYALSAQAQEILAEGDAQIFQPSPARLADGWLLVVFSVPESERAKRHTLRSRLSALGFGAAAPGVWVAPAHRRDLTAATLRRLGLESYVDLFRADYLAFTDLAQAVGEWWDLSAIHKSYVEFTARWEGLDRSGSPAEAFAGWVRLLTDWRRLPYLDPGLPPELLPAGWPGAQAAELFHRLRARLAGPAHDHVRLVSAAMR
ncbi:MAG TPA: PaaX family transcriptional regulator C-terminal domain-containing protein [Micromonosporaceae bacterium]|nr:PaaX family transcriptional regulator C-terminal domain-containing protein [Micromonosporaceae bacterium]